MDDAKKELTWFIVIVVGLGVIWIASGGPKSLTKNSPLIKGTATSTGQTTGGSFFGFLFPQLNTGTSSGNGVTSSNSQGGTYSGNSEVSGNSGNSSSGSGSADQPSTIYGAANPPGPIVNVPDKVTIRSVSPSYDQNGKAGSEYVELNAPATNKGKVLISGMLLKSRLSGNQASIGEGVTVYYANSINSEGPIFLAPGETADIITGRSPIGYSFKTNKCVGYLNNNYQNFVVSMYSNCPRINDYPLPARPNAFSDKCLDFIDSISSCQIVTSYPTGIESSCQTFVAERANYTRCVTDFVNDKNFLGSDWRIFLARDTLLWKTRREIIDLVDQKGNVVSTYTY
jgi:hypothetical protein